MAGKRFHSQALHHVHDEIVGTDRRRRSAFQREHEETLTQIEASRLLHDTRTAAGLSQRELAKRAGTTASVICRMEDADYEGHTLAMLRRIAAALGRRIELQAIPMEKA